MLPHVVCGWIQILTLKQRAVNQKPLNRQGAGYVFLLAGSCRNVFEMVSPRSYFEGGVNSQRLLKQPGPQQ